MLIATAHGNCLESLIKNPTLSDLVGGIQSVTLGDDEAKRRASQKTVLEREKQPTFDIVIEILDRNTLAVYKNTSEAVDYILRGWPIRPELRKVDKDYKPQQNTQKEEVKPVENVITEQKDNKMNFTFSRQDYVEKVKALKKVYLYAVSRTIVEKIIERLDLNVEITRNVEDADIVIAHKNFAKGGAKILSTAQEYRVRVFYVKTNSMAQIQKVLKDALDLQPDNEQIMQGYVDETEKALDEAKIAIKKITSGEEDLQELSPQNQQIRKLQHELAEQYNLKSTSVGDEPNRRLRIFKP